MSNKEYKIIGRDIVGAAYTVRKNVGRGLLEKFYEAALAYELRKIGYKVECQVPVPAVYCGEVITDAYRADIIVDNKVIIEVKAITSMQDRQFCQLYTYLKLSEYRLGYLINFGAKDFSIGSFAAEPPYEQGIYSIVNKL